MAAIGPDTPGPGAYNRPPGIATRDFSSPQAPSFSLSGRTGASKSEKLPGPGAYSPRDSPRGPAVSLGGRTRVFSEGVVVSPGPGAYNPDDKRGTGPRVSLSGRNKEHSPAASTPGPGAYTPPRAIGTGVPDKKASPSFSMGARYKDATTQSTPGAGAYSPQLQKTAPSFSLSPRTSSFATGSSASPGPGAYSPKPVQSKIAVTLGARDSIYKVPKSSVNFKQVDPVTLSPLKSPKRK
jgi:hypothetical protein